MRFVFVLVAAACGSKSPPTPAKPTPVAITPADVSTFTIDPASGFEVRVENVKGEVFAEVKKNDKDQFIRYDVWSWDPKWPSDVDAFAAKLKEQSFLDETFRYDVTKKHATADEWEFRGNLIQADGTSKLTFVLVRIVGGKGFLCKGTDVEDEMAIDAAIANCRAAKL